MKDIIIAWINRPKTQSAMVWDLKGIVIVIAVLGLMEVVTAMVWMFVQAILDPTVNDEIVFSIVGPAFQNIIGTFGGLAAGIQIGKGMSNDNSAE